MIRVDGRIAAGALLAAALAATPALRASEYRAALRTLARRLRDTFDGADAVHAWLRAPHRVLAGVSPVAAISAGHVERVNAALDALGAGIFI